MSAALWFLAGMAWVKIVEVAIPEGADAAQRVKGLVTLCIAVAGVWVALG